MTPEGSLVRTIRDWCSRMRIPCDRMNSGAFPIEDGKGKRRFFRAGVVGFPDLILYLPGTVLFVECKTSKGRLTPAQVEFRERCYRLKIPHLVARDLDDVVRMVEAL